MSTQAFDVFLSYHSEDRALAQQVYASLTDGQALRVWWDAKSIPPGELWVRAIDDGFSRARVFVVLLSDRAPRRWVEAEVSRALHCYFSELPGPRHILPVLIGDQPLHGVPNALSGFLSVFQAAQLSAPAGQSTADGLSELGASVRRLLGEPETTPKAAPAQPLVTEPFLGLASFDERHSHLFFGRQDETAALVDKLEQPGCRWLQVDGASGTGKSSLVKAGLLPAMARRPSRPGQPDWLTLVMRPGTNPIKALADALLELDAGQNPKGTLTDIENRLSQNPQALTNELRQWNKDHQFTPPRSVLLVVDQFEELFASAQHDAASSPAQFIRLVLAALDDRDGPFRLVSTIRSDCQHHVAGHPDLSHRLNSAERYTVPAMAQAGLAAAIEQPLRLAGGRLASPALLQQLLDDTLAGPGRLPLLSHTLAELWQKAREVNRDQPTLTFDDYQTLGGVAGAVNQSADRLLDSLENEADQTAALRMFLELVELGRGTADRRRARPKSVLLSVGGPHAEPSLLRLSGQDGTRAPLRLLTVDEQDQVDVIHDVLISDWPRLKSFLQAHRRDLERRDDLESAAHAWDTNHRDREFLPAGALLAWYQHWQTPPPPHVSATATDFLAVGCRRDRKRRVARWAGVAVLIAVAVVFAALGYWANNQRLLAQAETNRANENAITAERNATIAKQNSHNAEKNLELSNHRLKQAQELAHAVLFELDTELTKLAGSQPVRKRLVESVSKLVATLKEEGVDDIATLHLEMIRFGRDGEQALTHGKLDQAEQAFRRGLDLAKRLVVLDPGNWRHKSNVGVCLNKLADLQVLRGNVEAAQPLYEEDLKISRTLAAADPGNAQSQRDVSVSLGKLADLQVLRGNIEAAQPLYKEALKIRRTLAAADPGNAQSQREVSVSLDNLADLQVRQGNVEAAQPLCEEALKISRTLATWDPGNAKSQRDVSVSLNKLADLQVKRGNVEAAQPLYEEALKISRTLAAADPGNAQSQRDVSVSLYKLGRLERTRFRYDAAKERFAAAIGVLEKLIAENRLREQAEKELAILKREVALTELAELATKPWDDVLKLPREAQPKLLALRITELARKKDRAAVVQAAEHLSKLEPRDGEQLYNAT
ncbi:MAG: TIR domain-containing protein [Planctomycetota bacterium]|nr:TIR domain-containing protein [Planctomycetota bacterium]